MGFCFKCGQKLAAGETFCPACGSKQAEDTEEEEVVEVIEEVIVIEETEEDRLLRKAAEERERRRKERKERLEKLEQEEAAQAAKEGPKSDPAPASPRGARVSPRDLLKPREKSEDVSIATPKKSDSPTGNGLSGSPRSASAVSPPSVTSPDPVIQRRMSSATKRMSGRFAMCEWEDGGVEVVKKIHELFTADSTSGWVLVQYRSDNATLYLSTWGTGGVSEIIPHLDDSKQQYIMTRIIDRKKLDVNAPMTRDVLITWQGENVPVLQRGRFGEHKNVVAQLMEPVHAHLTCVGNRKAFTEENIQRKSDPLSGSHEL